MELITRLSQRLSNHLPMPSQSSAVWRLSSLGLLALALASCRTGPREREALELFDGKTLSGWDYVLADSTVKMDQVWSVQDGILTCQGSPIGFLYKGPDATNFRLVVEYRWRPGETPGNSGIFSRINGAMKPIPQAVEVQLKHGSAGDVMGLQGRKVVAGQPRFFEVKAHPQAGDIAGVKKLEDAEKSAGEWNHVEIVAQGPRYSVSMNGKLINEAEGVEVVPGPIGLQSEGGIIQFRKVTLVPLD